MFCSKDWTYLVNKPIYWVTLYLQRKYKPERDWMQTKTDSNLCIVQALWLQCEIPVKSESILYTLRYPFSIQYLESRIKLLWRSEDIVSLVLEKYRRVQMLQN